MPPINTKYFALLRCLHRGDHAGAQAFFDRNLLNFQEFTATLEQYQLAGYGYILLSDAMLAERLEPAERERLKSAFLRQQQRNERLLSLLTELHDRLGNAGVPFLVIKGFLQSVRFAGGIDRRFMWDQDILIRPEDLGTTIAITENMGLRAAMDGALSPSQMIRHLHAIERVDGKRKVDIHWVFRNRHGMRKTYEQVSQNAQPLHIGDAVFQGISDLDSLTLASVGLADDMERNRIKIRKVWDVYLILYRVDATTDWESWAGKLEEEGSLKTILNVLSFCVLLLDASDDVPRITGFLHEHQNLLLIDNRDRAHAIMTREGWNLANRILMSRLQSGSAWHYWASWLAGLPMRQWHYRKRKRRRPASRKGN